MEEASVKYNPRIVLDDRTLENKGREEVDVCVIYNHGNPKGTRGSERIGTANTKPELKNLIESAKQYVAAIEKGESELMRWGKLYLEGNKQ